AVEKNIKEQFKADRENKSREIYFYNPVKFENYVTFIKSHELFVEEIFIKQEENKPVVKIVKKTTPSLKERGLTHQGVMEKAKRIKYDEFYTRYEDVEKEISMYDKSIWKDKTVFCNCDDAIDKDDEKKSSAFAWYFYRNFKELGLNKLICTHYAGKVDLFNQGSKAYVAYISFTTDGDTIYRDFPKGYDGSFDHPISLKILKEEADIVCTNPPFSRMQEYWKIVVESGKKFLIISNVTSVKNQPYILYIRNSRVWAGYNRVDYFLNPKRQLTDAAGHWFTNFPVKNRPKYALLKIMPLKDIPEKYKRYDDSKILVVDNGYIPGNVKKPFAVSVRVILNGILEKGYKLIEDREYVPYINGKRCFGRILVQKI
ncbi:MAG: adenine-specific methyltransferase EcoRI family protein, partial [Dysgonamonadaceae bacterium]|nr:adenine-specific methyltransferase EcoRI family protein [Dysgonamonadaceae bacterium]